MDFRLTLSEEEEAFRANVERFAESAPWPELVDETHGELWAFGPEGRKFIRMLGEQGFLGISYPKEYGGGGKGWLYLYLVLREMWRRNLPTGMATADSMGPMILKYGSEELKREWLPPIIKGEIIGALGYSEPNAGTDLASLETSAERQGDEYVFNGQKIYTSAAHTSEFIWLAARTDPTKPKHKGLSLFICPTNTPGVIVRPLYCYFGHRSNEVFFENARIPARNLVGQENEGWSIIMGAIDLERVLMVAVGRLGTHFELLVDWVKNASREGKPLAGDPVVRHQLAETAVQLEVLRLLEWQAVSAIQRGESPTMDVSLGKMFRGDLLWRVYDRGLEILGPSAQLLRGSKWAPLQGVFEHEYHYALLEHFGAASPDILRDIIGRRGLGLPRSY